MCKLQMILFVDIKMFKVDFLLQCISWNKLIAYNGWIMSYDFSIK